MLKFIATVLVGILVPFSFAGTADAAQWKAKKQGEVRIVCRASIPCPVADLRR